MVWFLSFVILCSTTFDARLARREETSAKLDADGNVEEVEGSNCPEYGMKSRFYRDYMNDGTGCATLTSELIETFGHQGDDLITRVKRKIRFFEDLGDDFGKMTLPNWACFADVKNFTGKIWPMGTLVRFPNGTEMFEKEDYSNYDWRSATVGVVDSGEQNNSVDANYKTAYKTWYHGVFEGLIHKLDMSYHTHLDHILIGRRLWQEEAVIYKHLNRPVKLEPVAVFTGGPMGAGKSFLLHTLKEQGAFPADKLLVIDFDEFKYMMPEFYMYNQMGHPEAGTMCKMESNFLGELLYKIAVNLHIDFLQDGSLRDMAWYEAVFKELVYPTEKSPRLRYEMLRNKPTSQRKVVVIGVKAAPEVVKYRVLTRAASENRTVPPQYVTAEAMKRTVDSVEYLGSLPYINDYVMFDCSGKTDKNPSGLPIAEVVYRKGGEVCTTRHSEKYEKIPEENRAFDWTMHRDDCFDVALGQLRETLMAAEEDPPKKKFNPLDYDLD